MMFMRAPILYPLRAGELVPHGLMGIGTERRRRMHRESYAAQVMRNWDVVICPVPIIERRRRSY